VRRYATGGKGVRRRRIRPFQIDPSQSVPNSPDV